VIDSLRIEAPEPPTATGREAGRAAMRRRHLRWLAILGAALLHLSPALLLLLYWPGPASPKPPPSIPVKLVIQQPPQPAPPPPPAKPTPPEPPDTAPRRSGQDQTTTAPPPGEAAETHDDAETGEASAETPGQSPPPGTGEREEALLDPGATFLRPAERSKAPVKAPPERKRPAEPPRLAAIGANVTNGDPYLNAVMEDIVRHLSFPDVERPRGNGVAVYYIEIDKSGQLKWLDLVRSTGVAVLDAAAERSIRAAVPFPPPPPHFVGQSLRLTLPMIP